MSTQLKATEISGLIKSQIANFDLAPQIRTEGSIVSLKDGIVRIYGLDNVMFGEMIEFPGNTFGLALNL
ncbi:MAG: F0F1 ATP synthase subunit alpha, partial [Proteobacteria bacterium]|nr:F0F1 ATP synthase subunit alpha [Pseudomonadota bacterium]